MSSVPHWANDHMDEGRYSRSAMGAGREANTAVIFDKGRSASKNPESDLGFNYNHALFGVFHNRPDLKPATRVVTAALMGDPTPGRRVPVIEADEQPAPIYLTFKDLRRGMEEA